MNLWRLINAVAFTVTAVAGSSGAQGQALGNIPGGVTGDAPKPMPTAMSPSSPPVAAQYNTPRLKSSPIPLHPGEFTTTFANGCKAMWDIGQAKFVRDFNGHEWTGVCRGGFVEGSGTISGSNGIWSFHSGRFFPKQTGTFIKTVSLTPDLVVVVTFFDFNPQPQEASSSFELARRIDITNTEWRARTLQIGYFSCKALKTHQSDNFGLLFKYPVDRASQGLLRSRCSDETAHVSLLYRTDANNPVDATGNFSNDVSAKNGRDNALSACDALSFSQCLEEPTAHAMVESFRQAFEEMRAAIPAQNRALLKDFEARIAPLVAAEKARGRSAALRLAAAYKPRFHTPLPVPQRPATGKSAPPKPVIATGKRK